MAQLRDKQTSEFVFEGTPEECTLLAEKLGRDNVVFDGVGQSFEPDAVLTAHAESQETRNAREHVRAVEETVKQAVKKVERRVEDARARVDG